MSQIAKKQIAQFVELLDQDYLEKAREIYLNLNEHRRLDALSAAIPAQAIYFQDWLKATAECKY